MNCGEAVIEIHIRLCVPKKCKKKCKLIDLTSAKKPRIHSSTNTNLWSYYQNLKNIYISWFLELYTRTIWQDWLNYALVVNKIRFHNEVGDQFSSSSKLGKLFENNESSNKSQVFTCLPHFSHENAVYAFTFLFEIRDTRFPPITSSWRIKKSCKLSRSIWYYNCTVGFLPWNFFKKCVQPNFHRFKN